MNKNSAKGNIMKKLIPVFLSLFILTLTACGSAPRSNSSNFGSATQNGTAAGALPATTQIAIGTLKLDNTDNAITTDQAAKLLPLWETMKILETSDTAAKQEIDALDTQIQETMTDKQMQAITAMNLTRQNMFAVMQTQGVGFGNGQQNNSQQSGNSSNNRGFTTGGFGPGGPPDGGAFPAGGQGFGRGQGQNRSASQIATAQAARQAGGGNRIPAPLINALIEFLKKKAGS
jgi:hypothetical protein